MGGKGQESQCQGICKGWVIHTESRQSKRCCIDKNNPSKISPMSSGRSYIKGAVAVLNNYRTVTKDFFNSPPLRVRSFSVTGSPLTPTAYSLTRALIKHLHYLSS